LRLLSHEAVFHLSATYAATEQVTPLLKELPHVAAVTFEATCQPIVVKGHFFIHPLLANDAE
jgi:hypothetical protein